MCSLKRLCIITTLALFIASACAYGKKRSKFKRPSKNEENGETTPQPNVVTYSTFGFNDVGPTYDGFVPSSPDYARYLSGSSDNQETTTRLYGPAFPTAMDNTAYAYGQQPQEVQSYSSGAGSENGEQTSMLQYDPNSYSFGNPQGFGPPTGDSQINQEGRGGFDENEDYNAPVYGTKLSNGNQRPNKIKQSYGQYNTSNMYGTSDFISGDVKYTNYHEQQPAQESKQTYGESGNNAYKPYNYVPSYPPSNSEDIVTKPPLSHAVSSVKFHKVVDFTKFKPTYPTELELNNKYAPDSLKPMAAAQTMSNNNQNDNSYMSPYQNPNNDMNQAKYHDNYEDDEPEKDISQPMKTNHLEFSINHVDNSNSYKNQNPAEYKDKFKSKPWNYSSDFTNWKNTLKNYDSFIDFKNSSYKRPYKTYTDEVTSSSNSVVDLTSYKFPENSYANFKRIPDYRQQGSENYPSLQTFKYPDNDDQNSSDFFNQLKGLYSTVPSTTTHWGSSLKVTETPPYKHRPKKPQQFNDDDIVHIPKRHKYHIKPHGHKQNEWSNSNRYRGKPIDEWNKEVPNRFKSEEDLLGLRNHDTSHPSYLPQTSFKLTNEVGEEYQKYFSDSDYKKLVDKWRQSYLKSKFYKDSMTAYRDSEAYGTDSRPMHVPVPKPFPIEVPHPVIVPVPQPYPVRVPVPKPVAVPVIRELTVPIEKPVPYPVYKKVPYPVEKLVPYPVEKEVQVPVPKPYAVPVPHVRPVFHHSRPALDELDGQRDADRENEEDDYMPRPAASSLRGQKYVKYYKKTRSNRNRSRRPASSSAHYERNRRRWPTGRPAPQRSSSTRARRPRPTPPPRHNPSYHHDYEEDYDHDHTDYFEYCRRNGNC